MSFVGSNFFVVIYIYIYYLLKLKILIVWTPQKNMYSPLSIKKKSFKELKENFYFLKM